MRVYLSIDLDYWNGRKFPEQYFDDVLSLEKPTIVVQQHHYLLEHVKKHQKEFDTLVNIDWHSDIADRIDGKRKFSKQCPLNCGTWLNYINGKNKRYIWSYPDKVCVSGEWQSGYCHIKDRNPFTYENHYEICRWSVIEQRYRWFPSLDDVIAVGISISPGWADTYLISRFKKWHNNKKVNLQMECIR